MVAGRLLLVDGMAVVYRAFYAIRGLTTAAGKPTNAVFGFIRMLGQLRDVWTPSHWAVVFDGGLSEEKIALFREYKAQRPPMPEALREQLGAIETYLDLAEVCHWRQEGQEADDVIASLAAAAPATMTDVLIATSDKDLCQVVGPRTRLVPVSGKAAPTGSDGVAERTGVAPGQIVEWLALVGDSVDNLPGVPGIGPKTAARLLGEYGTLERLWPRLHELDNAKVRHALQENRELIARNMLMVRLREDLPCPVAWDSLKMRRPNPERLIPFCEDLEFKAMAHELRQADLFSAMGGGV
jgi:DNA polymerase-1